MMALWPRHVGLRRRHDGRQQPAIARLLERQGPSVSAKRPASMRLSDGKMLYEKDADQLVEPASVTKVVTSAAVLTRFTPVQTFKTTFWYTGSRKNDELARRPHRRRRRRSVPRSARSSGSSRPTSGTSASASSPATW